VSRLAVLALLALATLVLQGAAAALVSPWLVPDLGLLLVVSVAVAAGPAEGMLVAAAVGLGTDLLTGAPVGHHLLLRLVVFAVARVLAAPFHLRTATLCALVFGLCVLDALGTAALTRFFAGMVLPGPDQMDKVALRALFAALLAPAARAGVTALLAGLTAEEQRRRDVRLDTRRPLL
jgi:rod shape-determining protein MreD